MPNLTDLESRLSRLTQSLIAVQTELAVVKTEIDVLKGQPGHGTDVLSSLHALEERQGHITRTLIQVQTEIQRLRKEVDALKPATVKQETPVLAKTTLTTATPPPVKPAASKAVETPPKPKRNLEEFIGGNVINKIGIVILVIGFAILLKYAIDNDWINELTRVVIGLVAGGVVLGFAFKLKPKYHGFSAVLLSGGMAILFFSVYAAYAFYHFLGQELAFVLLFVLTAFTVFAAVMYDQQVIGIIGLVGAYAVPFLVSEDEGRIAVLLTYMTVLNFGILILAFRKNWNWLNYLAFSFTWLIFFAWYADRFQFEEHAILTASFEFLFFLMFYTMVMAYKLRKKEPFHIKDIVILSFNSFFFYGIGVDILTHVDNGAYQGLFTAVTAALHFPFALIAFRAGIADRRFFFLQIGLVLSFLSLSIPVQLDGEWVTIIWSLQSVILFAIGRTQKTVFYERLAYVMVLLSVTSLLNDWGELYTNYPAAELQWSIFLNTTFLTSCVAFGSLLLILWLQFSPRFQYDPVARSLFSRICGYVIAGFMIVVAYFAVVQEIELHWQLAFVRSEVTTDYTEYDFSVQALSSAWVYTYTFLFLTVAFVWIRRKGSNAVFNWIALSFLALALIGFLFGCLDKLNVLRHDYLEGSPYYVYGLHHILIRYACFAAVLIALLAMLRATTSLPIHRFLYLLIHSMVVILLSHELLNVAGLMAGSEFQEMEYDASRMGYTILWGVYSLALIVYGIARRQKWIRFFAIGLFTLALLKLYIFDLTDISTGGKIISFIALGILLLTISFLYQKFKKVLFAEDQPV